MECCDDNPADYVSQAGTGEGYDSLCEPLPHVLFEPVSGTRLIMPSLVTLRSDNPDAVIHYTTDGSTPDLNSPIYSTPLTISSPGTLIRAIAIVDGCPEGPEAAAQYQQWSPAAHFTYGCGVVDKSGQWLAFAADGNPDYNWQLQIQFSAVTGVKEFQVLQLFPDGKSTGAAWSTKEYIYPWEDDATKQHRAFPLVMWNPDHTGAQVNVAYVDDFSVAHGNFGIGSHTRTFYGSPWTAVPATHLFKLKIVFQDGSILERIVDSTCVALPAALCPIPTFTLTPQCGPPLRIDVTFSVGVGVPYGIYRRITGGQSGDFVLVDSGNTATSPQTFQDTGVNAGVSYEYTITTLPPSCIEYRYSDILIATGTPNPSVSIVAFPTTIDSGANTTISWASTNISGTVSIAPTIGAQPGNVAGNQVVAPVVTTTYTITGVNVCGTSAQAQVTVTVRPPATCGASQPDIISIDGYSSYFFITAINGANCPTLDVADPNDPDWVGYWIISGVCQYQLAGTQRAFLGAFRRRLSTASFVRFNAGQWKFQLWGLIGGVGVVVWEGTKATGDTALGTYVRTSGCADLPATLGLSVVSSASCGGSQPGTVQISGYVDNFFVGAFAACPNLAVPSPDPGPWDGKMTYRPWVGPCAFLTDYSVYSFIVNGGGRRVLARATVSMALGVWVLTIYGYQIPAGDTPVWSGTKAYGDTPVGVYARSHGCDATIPSVTLVAI